MCGSSAVAPQRGTGPGSEAIPDTAWIQIAPAGDARAAASKCYFSYYAHRPAWTPITAENRYDVYLGTSILSRIATTGLDVLGALQSQLSFKVK